MDDNSFELTEDNSLDSSFELTKEEFCSLARKKIKLVYKNYFSDWYDIDEDCDAALFVGKDKYKINCSKSWLESSPTLVEQFQNVNQMGNFHFRIDENEKISVKDARTVLQWLKIENCNIIENLNPFNNDEQLNIQYKLSFIELLEVLGIQATHGMYKLAKLWKLGKLENDLASLLSTNISNNNINDLLVLTNKYPNHEINMALKNYLLKTNIVQTVRSIQLGSQYSVRKLLNSINEDVIIDESMYHQKRKRIPSVKDCSEAMINFIPRRSKRSKKLPFWTRLQVQIQNLPKEALQNMKRLSK